MDNGVLIGESEIARLVPHPLRTTVLGEVHARPFNALAIATRILHFAFETAGVRAVADRKQLVELCRSRGLQTPLPEDKHFRLSLGGTNLRWEQHSEFTTYTWEVPVDPKTGAFHPAAASLASPMRLVAQPGPHLVAVDLNVVAQTEDVAALYAMFDHSSLAVAENSDGTAMYATDFQLTPEGFVRILLVDRGLGSESTGAIVQHLLDIETYRTLALLGLPEAQRLAPSIALAEKRLAEVTERMRNAKDLTDNHQMLDELTALAADVEAGAARSSL